MTHELKLESGSKIAIIGGGPAGSFFAHFIHKFTQEKGIQVSTTIFDGKDFLQKGPRGCNLCAGVIAESLNQKLKNEGIHLPEQRIISRVEGYTLHVDGESLLLTCAENEKNAIATVFRGNGPRYSTFPEIISFDDFLLSWAQDVGAEVISAPVWDIKLPEEKSQPLTIVYGQKENLKEVEANLVVGAFGVNTYLMNKIKDMGFGYRAPSTLATYQAELKIGRENIQKNFGNTIHVYMPKKNIIRYATVIPKEDFITVTLIGKKDATKDLFQEFLNLEDIQGKIPAFNPHCSCYPKITVSPSKKPFTHRMVMIGDASSSRHYKNGIESAFLTARLAAETAIFYGVHASSFKKHYFKRAKKMIIRDNTYGRLLFFINDLISSAPILTQSHLSLAKKHSKTGPPEKIKRILWNMFTGNIPYRDIFKISLDLRLQFSLLMNAFFLLIKKMKDHIIGRIERHRMF
jgi:flavin-dependent dehydrogenase